MPGLGKVEGNARRTTSQERSSAETLAREEATPPLSTPPLSAQHAKALAQKDRAERIGRSERRPTTIREEPTTDACERKPPQPSLRPIEGRSVRASRAPEPGSSGSKPPRRSPTSRPPKTASISPQRSVRPARSARASIRIDDMGAAVKSGADAVGSAGRQVPKIVRTKDEIAEAPIDHRAGFLLAHIDSVTTVQGLVDIAGMPENEVHEILERLCRLGIVTIR